MINSKEFLIINAIASVSGFCFFKIKERVMRHKIEKDIAINFIQLLVPKRLFVKNSVNLE